MAYKFRFYRMGGLDQVAIETGEDLAHLHELDQKLWVALSCPVKGLEISERTLSLLDLDGDGRVRVPEVLAALRWCGERLRDLGALMPSADALPLAAIDEGKPAGKALLGAVRHILAQRGKPDAQEIAGADVADVSHVFDGTRFNGDGVIPPAAAEDPETQAAIADAISCVGGVPDRSGALGIDRAKLDAFFADLAAFVEWAKSGQVNAQIAGGFESVRDVRVKVDDWFNRCRIAEFDARLLAPEAAVPIELQMLPLAKVEPGAALPLSGRVNPAWSGQLAAFQKVAVAPLLGAEKTEITAVEWEQLRPRFAEVESWLAAKKGQSVEKLGLARAEALLQGGARARIEALLSHDEAFAPEANAVSDAVRLVHYKRDLHTLLKNFVSFHDFYDMRAEAVFQAGTLYLDSRSCNLCVRVDDMGSHATLASLSRMYIAYCDLKRPGQTMKIAACFTQGDSDYLMVGRNGLFYDRQGRDWDATIVRIIENPISIRQAFFAPYKKALRMIEEQVQKFAEAREKESEARMRAAAAAGVAPETPAKAPVDVGKMVGIVAALGVGVGAVGTLFGGFVAGFMALQPWWAKLLALVGAMLVISGPSMLLAWLKLRQRTLGPVLEGNGWAVNGRVRVNIPLGTALTDLKSLPPGSTRSLDDPFEDKRGRRRRRLLWLAAAVLGAAAVAAKVLHVWPFAAR
ncbi:MAG TPA: phage holin family protein [Myxococcales bacterium]